MALRILKSRYRALVLACCLWISAVATGDLHDEIIRHIEGARQSIDVLVYGVGSEVIASALVEARQRGVRVRVILDKQRSSEASSAEKILSENKIALRNLSLAQFDVLHEKCIIIDGIEAATPSYNRTDLRSEGEDVGGFTSDKRIIKHLKGEFERIWKAAR